MTNRLKLPGKRGIIGASLLLIVMILTYSCLKDERKIEAPPQGSSDTTVPFVVATSPSIGQADVSLNASVSVTFSEEMDATTFTAESFTLMAGASAVTGAVSFDGFTATFNPEANFAASTTYTASITTAVKDSAGNAMAAAYSFTFTSGTTVDDIAPTVVSTNPTADEPAANLSGSISITFSEDLDAGTVDATTILLKQGTTEISGVVTYSNKVATFNPDADLAASTLFTVTITTGIKDNAGNALASEESFSFTTGAQALEVCLVDAGTVDNCIVGN